MLPAYTRVRLVSDRHADEGACRGIVGYIIAVYPDGNYEVEFSKPDTGETVAQIVASESELEAFPESGEAARSAEQSSRIEYVAGEEFAQYPVGQTSLQIGRDGAATLEHRKHGQREQWTGRVVPATLQRFFGALARSRFPQREMWPPPPPGETLRVLTVANAKRSSVAIPWYHAMKQPGYADAFRLLDEIIGQLSGCAVRVVKDGGTVHVVDARRVEQGG